VYRILTSPWFHGGILHLIFNMLSLQRLGGKLEKQFGSLSFLINYVLLVAILCGTFHTGEAAILFHFAVDFHQINFMAECAIGISGILFCYIVINVHNSDEIETAR
jgi:rhomboid domain-containing protein 1